MKIAIIGSPLQDGNKTRGVGFYTKHLIENLKDNKNIELVETDNADLIHYPFFDPFATTLKIFNKPTIVTVHDLIPLQFKPHFPVGVKGNIKWLLQLINLRKASAILTVSEYSKKIINQITGISLSKIFVTHLSADNTCKPIKEKMLLQAMKQKYNLPDKFVLYVGDINWNKNIPTLVKICKDLKYPLVIVGSSATKKDVPVHPWTKDLLEIQNDSYPQKIGFIPDDELPIIYNLATIYCQPSHAEGFGLPPLQAMACGCPVICNMVTSLPEVVGKAALGFTKENFQKLWNNKSTRDKYIKLGLSQAKKFNWQTTAQKTMEVYAKII
jgi:glycosyltransferase involved in cell wall biosynthesis